MTSYWGDDDAPDFELELDGSGGKDRDDYPEFPPEGYEKYLEKRERADKYHKVSTWTCVIAIHIVIITVFVGLLLHPPSSIWWGVLVAIVLFTVSWFFHLAGKKTSRS